MSAPQGQRRAICHCPPSYCLFSGNKTPIDPVHNAPTCNGYNGGDHAGTPENPQVKGLVTGGGSGGGGSNWTGSRSSTPTYICAVP